MELLCVQMGKKKKKKTRYLNVKTTIYCFFDIYVQIPPYFFPSSEALVIKMEKHKNSSQVSELTYMSSMDNAPLWIPSLVWASLRTLCGRKWDVRH